MCKWEIVFLSHATWWIVSMPSFTDLHVWCSPPNNIHPKIQQNYKLHGPYYGYCIILAILVIYSIYLFFKQTAVSGPLLIPWSQLTVIKTVFEWHFKYVINSLIFVAANRFIKTININKIYQVWVDIFMF